MTSILLSVIAVVMAVVGTLLIVVPSAWIIYDLSRKFWQHIRDHRSSSTRGKIRL